MNNKAVIKIVIATSIRINHTTNMYSVYVYTQHTAQRGDSPSVPFAPGSPCIAAYQCDAFKHSDPINRKLRDSLDCGIYR